MSIGVAVILGLGLATRFLLTGAPQQNQAVVVDVTAPSEDSAVAQPTEQPVAPAPPVPQDVEPAPVGTSTPAQVPSQQTDPITTLEEDIAAVEEGPLRLSLPLECDYGRDCYIQSFVNAGPEDAPRDYACGSLTNQEQRGTDFRLIDYRQMEAGVDVVAAASGTVTIVRDGMPDANFKLFGRDIISDRGRGNVVAIDHGDGLVTGYSHLKRGSISVIAGQQVQRGQSIGQVGMSGLTEFPHVHFEVIEDGVFIDPFTGKARHEGCGLEGEGLWRSDVAGQLTYPRTLVMHTGFSDRILNRAAVEYRLFTPPPLPNDAPALVLHIYLSGIQEGDGFVAEITAPDGSRFVKSGRKFDRFQQAELLAIGRDNLEGPLQTGLYTARFQYFRESETGEEIEILSFDETVTVE